MTQRTRRVRSYVPVCINIRGCETLHREQQFLSLERKIFSKTNVALRAGGKDRKPTNVTGVAQTQRAGETTGRGGVETSQLTPPWHPDREEGVRHPAGHPGPRGQWRTAAGSSKQPGAEMTENPQESRAQVLHPAPKRGLCVRREEIPARLYVPHQKDR